MPYVSIRVIDEIVDKSQKKALIEQTTKLLQDVLDSDPATTHVVIDEVDVDSWGVDGVTVREFWSRE